MKRILGILMLCMMAATPLAFAQDNNGGGCGLGKLILDGKKGKAMHLGATSLNSLVPQSSAMTSNTSGCDTDNVILLDKEAEVFVAVNFDNLSVDMAQGSGNYLESMAVLMGCGSAEFGAFAALAQDKYEELVPGTDIAPITLVNGLKQEMAAHPALAMSCTRIS